MKMYSYFTIELLFVNVLWIKTCDNRSSEIPLNKINKVTVLRVNYRYLNKDIIGQRFILHPYVKGMEHYIKSDRKDRTNIVKYENLLSTIYDS